MHIRYQYQMGIQSWMTHEVEMKSNSKSFSTILQMMLTILIGAELRMLSGGWTLLRVLFVRNKICRWTRSIQKSAVAKIVGIWLHPLQFITLFRVSPFLEYAVRNLQWLFQIHHVCQWLTALSHEQLIEIIPQRKVNATIISTYGDRQWWSRGMILFWRAKSTWGTKEWYVWFSTVITEPRYLVWPPWVFPSRGCLLWHQEGGSASCFRMHSLADTKLYGFITKWCGYTYSGFSLSR